jgi:hypothetical protein
MEVPVRRVREGVYGHAVPGGDGADLPDRLGEPGRGYGDVLDQRPALLLSAGRSRRRAASREPASAGSSVVSTVVAAGAGSRATASASADATSSSAAQRRVDGVQHRPVDQLRERGHDPGPPDRVRRLGRRFERVEAPGERGGRNWDEDPCAIRRRAIATLAAHGVPATAVGDAGCRAGVLDMARTGQGAALLAAIGPTPEGLTRTRTSPRSPRSP